MAKQLIGEFHMENCGLMGKLLESKIQRRFLECYNRYVNASNPLIETYNDLYDAKLKKEGKEWDIDDYNNWMYDKFVVLARSINSPGLIDGDLHPESICYMGHLHGKPESKLYFTLKYE